MAPMSWSLRALRAALRAIAGSVMLLAALHCGPARSQDGYPGRPVRLVVPWPPAGPVDLTARIISQKLGSSLGRQLIVENRAGADGSIGTAYVARSPADGYTLLLGSTSTHSINPVILPGLAYDPVQDFSPIILVDTRPYILVIGVATPARSVQELIAMARAGRGELSNATAGASNQAAGEQFAEAARIRILHVPYQGGAPAMNALLGGQVTMFFSPPPLAIAPVQSGKLRALAITSATRSAVLPDLPTMAEGGLAGFEFSTWDGLLAPAGTPAAVIARINRETTAILGMKEVQDQFVRTGAATAGGSPADMARHLKLDAEKWEKALRRTPPSP